MRQYQLLLRNGDDVSVAAAEFSTEAAAASGTFMISAVRIIIMAEKNVEPFLLSGLWFSFTAAESQFTPNGSTHQL